MFKGTYPETLNAGIAAFRAGQAPDIMQVFDVGTGVMMAAEGAIKPVADVLTEAGMTFDKSQYLPGIVAYYSKPDGTMLSFPYNSSSPILYYNKDIFEKAGLDVDNPPKTWDEVWDAARKIKDSGAAPCGYTSTWLTWIHLENFAAWNNVPYATNENGLAEGRGRSCRSTRRSSSSTSRRSPTSPRTACSSTAAAPRRPSRSSSPANAASSPNPRAGSATSSSPGMNYGIGQLPYDSAAAGAPQNTIPGGASLWVFGDKSRRDLQGRRGLLQLPVADRGAGIPAPDLGLSAGDAGRLRGDQGVGLLRRRTRAARRRSPR